MLVMLGSHVAQLVEHHAGNARVSCGSVGGATCW